MQWAYIFGLLEFIIKQSLILFNQVNNMQKSYPNAYFVFPGCNSDMLVRHAALSALPRQQQRRQLTCKHSYGKSSASCAWTVKQKIKYIHILFGSN